MHNHTHPSSLSNSCTSPSSQPPNQHINLSLEGIHALRLALALNATLARLPLPDTHLGDAGAITLAEWMGEYRGLRWLDLTRNSRSNPDPSSGGRETARMGANGAGEGLGEAGVLELAQGVKVNTTLRCLDVEVPTGVEGYAREERIKELLELSDEVGILVGRVEEVEIRKGSHKERREQSIISSEGIVYEKTKAKPALRVKVPPNTDSNPSVSSTSTSPTLSTAIDSTVTSPPSATINITHLIFAISDSPPSTSPRNSSSPVFAVQESSIPHSSTLDIDTPSNTSHPSEANEDKNSPRRKDKGKARTSGALLMNGDMEAESEVESESGEEENDGGGEVEREDGDASCGYLWDGEAEAGVRSQIWVAEEGEVFRKGNVLLGPEEIHVDKYIANTMQLLEAMVERLAPRSLHIDNPDEYGSILTPSPLSPTSTPISSTLLSTPLTPVIPPPA
ncbi:hypothetical protein F5050DRAFT_1864898 [Lentinula boryana]|uniref:RNI-like protein n=1 Tax=Lentinula boryana TaxID=40481 RepID=A0ABQ8PZV7_9AGAR|nr:hypothetical protein F5050DRAFT_1864898 [Lentinula boryana]